MHSPEIDNLAEHRAGFWGFFIDNWRVTLLLILLFVFSGVLAIIQMPLESDPEVKIPIAVVTTAYPGASPADIEKLVTDRLETRIKNLENLEEFTSSSSQGVSSITVQFFPQADLNDSLRKLRDEISSVKSELPSDAREPIVTEIRTNDMAMVTISLLANLPPSQLKQYGDALQDLIERVSGVSEVLLSGISDKEMQVLLDIQKMDGYNLSFADVVNTLATHHLDYPIGSLLTDQYYYQLSLKGQLNTVNDLLDLPLGNLTDSNIYLRDIATVREVFGEQQSGARVYRAETKDYRDSVTLQVKKKAGANIVEVVDAVKDAVADFKTQTLPPSVDVLITNDNSEFIREDLSILLENALQAVAIIIVLLLLVLGWKEAIVAGISLPLIFLLSFVCLELAGETINGLVLFSLVLALGMIIDNSIVMMEDFHENIREKKLSARGAALLAISNYRAPLIAGTLTTAAAFLPMLLMTGIMGEYVKHIPITVMIALLTSLFVSLQILPAIAARIFQNFKPPTEPKRQIIIDWLRRMRQIYRRYITGVLLSKLRRRTWIIGMVVAFLITITFPFVGILGVQMFPKINLNFFSVQIELPTGATLEATDLVASRVGQMVEGLPGVENFVTILGGGSLGPQSKFGMGGAMGTNTATLTVNLLPKEKRTIKSQEIAENLRNQVAGITDARVEVVELQAGPPSGAPVEVRIIGEDVDILEKTAVRVQAELKKIPGTRDIDTDIAHGTAEFQLIPRRDILARYKISSLALASELRTVVMGNDSVKILRNGEETPIIIRADFRATDCLDNQQNKLLEARDGLTICRNNPRNISEIQNLLIATPRGRVSLSELVDISLYPVVTTIRHREGETVVNVKAYTLGDITANDIIQDLKQSTASWELPKSVRLDFGGETEDTTESYQSLFRAMIVGIFLIALILVFQFNSYRQPFIILFTIPLSLIGVFAGLSILGLNFSFPGFIGIVAALGVVVSNGILLITKINENIRSGKEKFEAIVSAGEARLQPIVLNGLTAVIGDLPLAFGSEIWRDLIWSMVFGILFSTILTLVMVPIFYNALVNEKEIKHMR